jgi:hypothetical protein
MAQGLSMVKPPTKPKAVLNTGMANSRGRVTNK